MRRVVVTGMACSSAAPGGLRELAAALAAGAPLGECEAVDTLRGRRRELRVARLAPFDRETALPAQKLRRMDDLSQVWTIACLAARADAGLDGADTGALPAPERRATFLGTGFGCIGATWDYLATLSTAGAAAANPYLFSESVANAPAGHSAIELDARGPSCTLTCADASGVAAVAAGMQAVESGRADMAYCGGAELLPPPLVRVLAAAGAPPFLGEGCACLVLESLESARRRGARIHAEIARRASASDPCCSSALWSVDAERMAAVLRRAANTLAARAVRSVFLHGSGWDPAEAAESRAASALFPDARAVRGAHVFGCLAGAGSLGLALAALDAGTMREDEAAIAAAWAWGGGLHALKLSGPPT